MNKSYFILLFFMLSMFGIQLQAQDKQPSEPSLLHGQLIDAEDKTSIAFVHITNLSRGLRGISDPDGFFKIPATAGDSLLISGVSYGQQKVLAPAITEELWVLELKANVYELEEVVVKSLPSERRFKEMLLSMEVPAEEEPNMRLPAGLSQKAGTGNAAIGLGSPVSAIAAKFSKKERGRQFAAEMRVHEDRRAYIQTKFNRSIVQEITGLEDEDSLDKFMKYCVLSEDFLYKANEYEIHKAVLGCFQDFSEEQQKG